MNVAPLVGTNLGLNMQHFTLQYVTDISVVRRDISIASAGMAAIGGQLDDLVAPMTAGKLC